LDVLHRKKSWLSDPSWKKIPWRHTKKTPKDTLTDIVIEIPGVLEEIDRFQLSRCGQNSRASLHDPAIQARIQDLENELNGWYQQNNPIISSERLASDDISVAVAHVMSAYWATKLLLLGIRQVDKSARVTKSYETDLQEIRENIFLLLPQLVGPQSGLFGRHIAAYPAGILQRSYGSQAMCDTLDEDKKRLLLLFESSQTDIISSFMDSMDNAVKNYAGTDATDFQDYPWVTFMPDSGASAEA
jgi:hypothetical protein